MRKVLFVLFLLISTRGYSQCVGEIKDVIQDPLRGSIIVETQYKLNGVVVDIKAKPDPNAIGRSRYLEDSGTNEEIIAKAKKDVTIHCKNLIKRMSGNNSYRKAQIIKRQKELTAPVIQAIRGDLIGHKSSVSEATEKFKDREIKVTHDKKNSIKSITSTLNPISR